MANKIDIEVAYATPKKQLILIHAIEQGTLPRQAVKDSGISQHFTDIDCETVDMGVFGKAIKEDYELQPGDRIELYRPLIADPKEVRKQRAKKGLATKKGGANAS